MFSWPKSIIHAKQFARDINSFEYAAYVGESDKEINFNPFSSTFPLGTAVVSEWKRSKPENCFRGRKKQNIVQIDKEHVHWPKVRKNYELTLCIKKIKNRS